MSLDPSPGSCVVRNLSNVQKTSELIPEVSISISVSLKIGNQSPLSVIIYLSLSKSTVTTVGRPAKRELTFDSIYQRVISHDPNLTTGNGKTRFFSLEL